MNKTEENYSCGECLGLFAESLVSRGHASTKKSEDKLIYHFNHPTLKELYVEIRQEGRELVGASNYDVKLTGPREQVNEFIRAAEEHLEKAKHSLDNIQMQVRERKRKSWKKGLEAVE